jgi:spermidine/putrescine transport system permease protein
MMSKSRIPFLTGLAVLGFFYLPILVLVVQSFNASRFGGHWGGFSLVWYERLFQNRGVWLALRNTLVVASVATVVSVILGTLSAWALHRYAGRLQRAHYLLIYSPLVMPDILMGISLLLLFVNLNINLGLLTIVLSHITFCVSYVAFTVLGRLQDFDHSLVEAAQDLGAGPGAILRRVLVPLLGPGIAAGALLAFTLSLDDFVVTFFVCGPGTTTLPVHVYSMMKHGSPALINALSVILMSFTFLIVLVSQRFLQAHR